MIARVTSIGRAEGLDFRFDRAVRPNTADAHRLLWWALRSGGAAAQRGLNDQLMAAYFTDGENIGDHDVLVDQAAEAGLDPTRPAEHSPTRRVSKPSPSPCSRPPTWASRLCRRSSSTRDGASRGPKTPTYFVRALRRVA